ncbi:hypothetical protein HanRHA438_Chr14g0631071 [Helianthus annuus]|nr:hypothetical protein HanRHA438_Chr14g0631071 [Helianthus annuus]
MNSGDKDDDGGSCISGATVVPANRNDGNRFETSGGGGKGFDLLRRVFRLSSVRIIPHLKYILIIESET